MKMLKQSIVLEINIQNGTCEVLSVPVYFAVFQEHLQDNILYLALCTCFILDVLMFQKIVNSQKLVNLTFFQ